MKRDDEVTAAEAADILGYRTPESVYQLYQRGELAGREERAGLRGKRLYFKRTDVEALAQQSKGE